MGEGELVFTGVISRQVSLEATFGNTFYIGLWAKAVSSTRLTLTNHFHIDSAHPNVMETDPHQFHSLYTPQILNMPVVLSNAV